MTRKPFAVVTLTLVLGLLFVLAPQGAAASATPGGNASASLTMRRGRVVAEPPFEAAGRSATLPANPGFTAIAAGGEHTCAVSSDGAVLCWGSDAAGQLGDGGYSDRSTPGPVSGLEHGMTAVAAGWQHNCALSSGRVQCWGNNAYGQLGDGTTLWRRTPKPVVGLESDVTAIAAGESHTCALTAAGAVLCWGRNTHGQLGDGSTAQRTTPVPVLGLESGVTAIAAGWYHTCALTNSGGVLCWGWNGSGQLGDDTLVNRPTPVPVLGLGSGMSSLAAGRDHTCAVSNTGGALCWGSNGNGRLGDGTMNQSSTPVPVSGLSSGVDSITAGHYHTCALTNSGAALCWGHNGYGQLGDGTTSEHITPTPVLGVDSGVVALTAGWYHTCAVTSAGPQCWGDNWSGQLGDGTTLWRTIPAAVPDAGSGTLSLAAGWTHTCELTDLGGVACWGSDAYGELGDGTTARRGSPLSVVGLGSGTTGIGLGSYHSCAVTSAGGAMCWGANWNGALGDGTSTPSSTPVPVSGLGSGTLAIAGGSYHSCALTSGGGLLCWGANAYGQLGDGTKTMRFVPVPVSGLGSGVEAIAAGGNHSCALTSSGGVLCWGGNSTGQLGDGTTTDSLTPIAVLGLGSGVTALAAGYQHTCALTGSGGVLCWGYNGYGQLGDGTTTWHNSPVAVPGLESGVVAIASGQHHTCAATSAAGVWCWGSNGYGQLGDGTTTRQYSPVPVQGLVQRVTALAAGGKHTCGLTSAGEVLCWGWDGYGQLGLGTIAQRTTPVAVVTRQNTNLPLLLRQ
jgi:alpha-tubulin suppressor-like RCC1 family protein